jgi:hypothetical protein
MEGAMHFPSLLHVRDHSKVVGRAAHVLEFIAQHINYHTGEAFHISIDRIAQRLDITPTWARTFVHQLIAEGEILVVRSAGRHPHRYRLPLDRCHQCQGHRDEPADLPADRTGDGNPQVELSVQIPPLKQPSSPDGGTLKSRPLNPQVKSPGRPGLSRLELRKDSKEERKKSKATSDFTERREEPRPQDLDPHFMTHVKDLIRNARFMWDVAAVVT